MGLRLVILTYIYLIQIQEKLTEIPPVSGVIPPPSGWIQHSVPQGKLLKCNKIENFNKKATFIKIFKFPKKIFGDNECQFLHGKRTFKEHTC